MQLYWVLLIACTAIVIIAALIFHAATLYYVLASIAIIYVFAGGLLAATSENSLLPNMLKESVSFNFSSGRKTA